MQIIKLWMAVCFVIHFSASMAFSQDTANAIIENKLVEFNFNLKDGRYTITDKRYNTICIENAVFQINQYVSDQGYTYKWTTKSIKDELGNGKKITIKGAKQDMPSLILEAFIYEAGCVVLNTGIENTTSKALRIMQYFPLKGVAFKGFLFHDYKTLDGENGVPFTRVSEENQLASNNNLLVTFGKKGERKRSLVIGGLTYNEFRKYASVHKKENLLEVELKADDPVGKLVDAKSEYILKDKFYIDFTTDNRFEALEKYGAALKATNHVQISGVNFPILNFWYAFIDRFGADENRDNSTGTVYEMEQIVKSGFLNYSPIGLRLEPDDYSWPNNQQGWWDDKHWQMYVGGQLLPPYETIVKWGKKIQSMGGVPFIYGQTAKRSEDYCLQFPGHTLFNNPYSRRSQGPNGWWSEFDSTAIYWTYDFTDRGFVRHMKDVYRNLKKGGVRGIKFDYPETGWAYDGGFEDKYATTTSAYRNIFRLAYDGLGKNRDVQERIPPFGDIALGVITTQRTEGDNDRVYPARITKTGLRWYKNRMVANYDHDPINPFHIYPADTRDGWRAAITMTYTTSGRMEIGKYFEKMTSEMIDDLSKAVPLLSAPARSARPIDAFSGVLYPRVYDFTVNPDWHIVTFYNTRIEGEEWPTDGLAYYTLNKQFIPKKMLPDTINVALGDKTDDGGLGLDMDKKYYVFDFWNWQFIGKIAGASNLKQELRPGEARVMAMHQVKDFPQFLSTSRHILQGYLDMAEYPEWHKKSLQLSAVSKLIGGEVYKVVIAANGYQIKKCSAVNAKCEIVLSDKTYSIYELRITGEDNGTVPWTITFER